MTAPTTDLPTVGDFLTDAQTRLDALTARLAVRRWEDIDPVAAVRELTRIVAQLAAAIRTHTEGDQR